MLAAVVDCDLAVHTHNDFGMATANAVAALEAGAVWADATVLGLGERAGCARLEELVGYLRLEKGQTGLAPEHLKGLAEYVADRSARSIDPARPLIGDRIFTCETGLHLQGLQKDPVTYEPYPPEQVGAERRLLFGAKCGRRALIERISPARPLSRRGSDQPAYRHLQGSGAVGRNHPHRYGTSRLL